MFLILFVVLIIAFYWYGTRNYDYWKKRGVKYEEPMFFFGSSLKQFTENVSVSERFANFHRRYPNEKIVGFFEQNTPGILVRDPELIKQIIVTDFRYFHRRGINPHKTVIEPLMKNLFTVDGDVWKLMRQKLTPTFSSGKLKAMFPLIVERTEKLAKLANDFAESGNEVDVREMMARYTTDFIGACGFGIESDALNDENSDFRKLGKRIFRITKRDQIVQLLKRIAPDTFKYMQFLAPEIERNTISLIRQIIAQRDNKPSGRNDFIDMMLELQQKGKIVGESLENKNPDGSPKIIELEFTEQLLAAQVFAFFAAGFETSSSASSFLLHMLAFHPEVQERCQKEVDEVLKKYDGKLCFEAVKDMKYLEMAFKESQRCLPSPGFLIRKAANKYTLPGVNVNIDEDTIIIISLDALCSDEQYFDNPDEFNPERFHPDNIGSITKNTFMPFGDGPRSCIGERMGVMQSMAGVVTILSKFTVVPCKNSLRKPKIDPSSTLIQNIIGGLPLAIKRRENIK